jgi:hypothetical protein
LDRDQRLPSQWKSTTSLVGAGVCRGTSPVQIGKETYMVSTDGNLMPVKKNQAAPNLKYFNPVPK